MKQLLTSLGLVMFGLHCTYSCHHFIILYNLNPGVPYLTSSMVNGLIQVGVIVESFSDVFLISS
jgi:hypothetical protein